MSYTARNITKEPPMSDTRHLAELSFEERPMTTAQAVETPAPQTGAEVLATDMVMLQKADVWMSQFKTRLNVGIIAMVVLWGTVSYYKSTDMHFEAKTAPEAETVLADGTVDENNMPIHAVETDSLNRLAPTEQITETAEPAIVEKTVVAPAPVAVKKAKPKVVKKAVAKVNKNKAAGGKTQTRNPKKLKKSLAAKPAS